MVTDGNATVPSDSVVMSLVNGGTDVVSVRSVECVEVIGKNEDVSNASVVDDGSLVMVVVDIGVVHASVVEDDKIIVEDDQNVDVVEVVVVSGAV